MYKCDTNCKDSYGHTSLHYAASNNHLEVVKYFINEQHSDPMTRNKKGDTPLHIACCYDHLNNATSSVRYTVHVKTMMAIRHFTMLVAMVAAKSPSTSSVRHTVAHHVRTMMVIHHFTLLVTTATWK